MDAVCRGQLQSTYQYDYLGLPQGEQTKSHNFFHGEISKGVTEITEVNLSAFVYKLFHEDFSSIEREL